MKKFILVYNPVSGDACFKYRLDDIVEKFLGKGCAIIPFRTSKDNLDTLVMLAKDVEAAGIIISGGDGTVHQVINVMLGANINLPVGIIPSGTCNDFATYLGIGQNLDSYIDVIVRGSVMPVDIGKINNQYFFNVASAGLLTSVAHRVDAALKNTLGKIAYYIKGLGELPHFRPLAMTITADGTEIKENVYMFLIVNSATVGGLATLIPAKVNDGRLDVLIVKQCSIPDLMSLFVGLLTGKNPVHHRSVLYLQAKAISIQCVEEVESDLDGELGPKLPLDITTLPGKIQLFYERMY